MIMLLFRLLLVILLGFFSRNAQAGFQNLPSLTILAESSLTQPITEVARLYAKNNQISVTTSFGSSASLIEKIDEGDAANVFITSDPEWTQQLKNQGVIDVYSIANIATNQLVLAIPRNHPLRLQLKGQQTAQEMLAFLGQTNTPFAIADPSDTAIGRKSLQIINHYQLAPALTPLMITSDNSRQVVYSMLKGNHPGIIYLTDVKNHTNIEVLNAFDPSLYNPVIYQATIVAGEQMEQGRNFLAALSRPEYQAIFAKYGFYPPK